MLVLAFFLLLLKAAGAEPMRRQSIGNYLCGNSKFFQSKRVLTEPTSIHEHLLGNVMGEESEYFKDTLCSMQEKEKEEKKDKEEKEKKEKEEKEEKEKKDKEEKEKEKKEKEEKEKEEREKKETEKSLDVNSL